MHISKRFRKIRMEKRCTLYNLSKISGIPIVYIKNIENGSTQPSIYILDKLLTALDSSIAELFDERKGSYYLTESERKIIDMIKHIDNK